MKMSLGPFELLHNSTDAVVDIVFVHGLGGYKETWTSNDGKEFWPKTLSADVPKAHIFTFRYNTNIVDFLGAQNEIDKPAGDLVFNLSGLRIKKKTNDRPIVFVAHSLGGLVCAQALLLADNAAEEEEKSISRYTRRIAFFGTPLRLFEEVKWAQMDTKAKLPEIFQGKSEKLSGLEKEFPDFLKQRDDKPDEKVEIMCFFEGEDPKIVPEVSACLKGYPNHSLTADHSSMCKFDGKDDERYREVSKLLQGWVEELGGAGSKVPAQGVHNVFSGTFSTGALALGYASTAGGTHQWGGIGTYQASPMKQKPNSTTGI